MKAQRVTSKFIDKMAFELEVNNHKFMIDADEPVGGENRGPRPKSLMQAALAGCTAMDVVSILRKMRVEFDSFQTHVDADVTEEHPKHYNKMHVIYEFTGKDLEKNRKKIEKAVNLSEERYCGVSFSYKQTMEITNEIVLIEK